MSALYGVRLKTPGIYGTLRKEDYLLVRGVPLFLCSNYLINPGFYSVVLFGEDL